MTHKNKHEHEDEHEDETADRGRRRGRGRGGAGEADRAQDPVAELDARYSAEGARAPDWSDARARLAAAEVFWLSTVRPDGRPHVTPPLSVWLDGALHFCTGPDERKARNLAANPHCVLTTGCNALSEGLDLVVEGHAVRVTDEAKLVSPPGRTRRSTAATGTSTSGTAPSTGTAARPWFSRWPR